MTLQYTLVSDSVRRALVRYFPATIQILGEYIPQMINDGTLPHSFTKLEMRRAFKLLEITVSFSSADYTLEDPFNPVTMSLKDNPLIKNNKLFYRDDWEKTFCLRPRHQMLDMIAETGWFRELEYGYKAYIPPPDVYEGELSEEDMKFLSSLYKKNRLKRNLKERAWLKRYNYFTDFADMERTPINNALVTKGNRFKSAFFNAVVDEGIYSRSELALLTGINEENIRNILPGTDYFLRKRTFLVKANSVWEALNSAPERGYAIKVDEGTYMVQLRSRLEKASKLREEVELKWAKHGDNHRNRGRISPFIKKNKSTPAFQNSFLAKGLRKVAKQVYKHEIDLAITDTADIIAIIRELEANNGHEE